CRARSSNRVPARMVASPWPDLPNSRQLKRRAYRPSFEKLSWKPPAESYSDSSVYVELLLVQCRIALHDNGALGEFFHLVQQQPVVSLEFLGYLGIHAQHYIFMFQLLGDLAHLYVNFVGDSSQRFYVAG